MSDPAVRSVVVYTPYKWEHALVTLRLIRPLQQAGIELIRGNDGMDIHPEQVARADAVVLQREFPEYIEIYDQILALARAAHKPVIYEIDDQLFELPETHIDYPTHYYSRALFAMLRAVIEADLVTTTTAPLLAYLSRFNPHTVVLPNYLDDGLWKLRPPEPEAHGSVVSGQTIIGYMGSNTHQPDLETIIPLLLRLLQAYPDRLRLRFWSLEPPALLREHPQVEWLPQTFHDYAAFASYFATQRCDLFIAPLIDSEFNRCKSAVKYLEYSALGIPGVYSRTFPYQSVIQDGENGFLAGNEAEWERCLIALIESPALRTSMGLKAYQAVQSGWLLSDHAGEWPQAYQEACLRAKDLVDQHIKQGYVDVFVSVANQVRGWQNKMFNQLMERDQKINGLQHDCAEQLRVIACLQEQAAQQEGLFLKIFKRADRKLMQVARSLRKRLSR